MSNQTGTKRSNEVMNLERRIAHLETLIRQIPSRQPIKIVPADPPDRVVRVRFNMTSGGDRSEGELMTDAGGTDASVAVWVDGYETMAKLPPSGFGDSTMYWAEYAGQLDRGGTVRSLYRTYAYFSGTNSGPHQLELNASYYGKVLDLAGTAKQTTIAGAAGDNILAISGLGLNRVVGDRYDWIQQRTQGGGALLDRGAADGTNRGSLNLRAGSFQSSAGGSPTGTTLSIDNGEAFRVDVWLVETDYSNSGIPKFIKGMLTHVAGLCVKAGSTVSPLSNGGRGAGMFVRNDESPTVYDAAKSTLQTWTGGTDQITIAGLIDSVTGASRTVTITFSGSGNGRYTAASASISGGAADVLFLITGGRAGW